MTTGAVRAGQAFVEVSLRDKIKEGARRIQSQLSGISAGFKTFGVGMAAAGAIATAAFGGLAAALAWPTKAAAELEQVSMQFEVMTGSAAIAQSMLAEIQQFAADTPFEFPGLAKAAKTLLAFGIANEKVVPMLKTLGDVSGGDQEKLERLAVAFGQVQSKGKLMAQEVNQMVENGFNPLQEISRTSGVAMKDLFKAMEDGKISSDMVTQAFQSATSQGGNFFGMMDKQAKTLSGRIGTLMDAINKAVRPIGQQLVQSLKPVIEIAIALVKPIGAFIEANKGIATALAVVATAGLGIGGVLLTVGGALIGVGAAIAGVAAAAPILAGLWATVTAAIAPVLPIIAAVAAGLIASAAAWGGILYIANQAGILKTVLDGIRSAAGQLQATMSQTFGGITKALSAGEYSKAAQILWAGVKLAFFQGAKAAYDAFTWLFNNGLSAAIAFGKALGQTLWNVFKAIPEMLTSALMGGVSLTEILAKAISGGMGNALDGSIANAQAELNRLTARDPAKKGQPGKGPGAPGVSASDIANATSKGNEENEKAIADRIKSLQDETTEMKLGANAFDLLKLKQQGATAEQLRQVESLQRYRDQLKAKAKAEEDAKKATEDAKKKAEDDRKDMIERGKKMTEEVRTPFQVFQDKIKEIDSLLAAGAISRSTAMLQRDKARTEFEAPMRDAMKSGRNTMGKINTQAALDIIFRTRNNNPKSPKNKAEDYAKQQTSYLKTIAESATKNNTATIKIQTRRI